MTVFFDFIDMYASENAESLTTINCDLDQGRRKERCFWNKLNAGVNKVLCINVLNKWVNFQKRLILSVNNYSPWLSVKVKLCFSNSGHHGKVKNKIKQGANEVAWWCVRKGSWLAFSPLCNFAKKRFFYNFFYHVQWSFLRWISGRWPFSHTHNFEWQKPKNKTGSNPVRANSELPYSLVPLSLKSLRGGKGRNTLKTPPLPPRPPSPPPPLPQPPSTMDTIAKNHWAYGYLVIFSWLNHVTKLFACDAHQSFLYLHFQRYCTMQIF